MINIINKENCCGCEACIQRCPKQCISFKEDSLGFLYPQVNIDKCIQCGLCEKVCPVLNKNNEKPPIRAFACKNKDEKVRMNSSSGGLFTAIALEVIRKKGIVFGVKFDSEWNIVFGYTDTEIGLKDFQGSKYAQARVGSTFKKVEHFLKDGRYVLFSGTSCQVAALHKYLQHDYENLLTIDFICHGVPSSKLFFRYLSEQLLQHSQTVRRAVEGKGPILSLNQMRVIKDIRFREKGEGWKKFRFSLTLAEPAGDGEQSSVIHSLFSNTDYGKLFLSDVALRPSCYKCPSKGGRSASDITIADFWGVDKIYPEFDDDKGITLAIINNEKSICCIPFEKIYYIETTIEEALNNNMGYFKSVSFQPKRNVFSILFSEGKSVRYIRKTLFPVPFKQRIKIIIRKLFNI